MQITQERFLDFLGKQGVRFVIPVFQRVYSWNARQCEELWDDIVRAGATGDAHFMGLVLFSEDAQGHGQLDVIDGQQRMTTLTLLLCALCAHVQQTGVTVAGETDRSLRLRYLTYFPKGQMTPAAKLTLSHMDRDTLAALVGAGEPPEEPAQRLIDNCQLFAQKMNEGDFDLAQLWAGLELLEIAGVQLAADDSPQLVFESLNSKGMPLTTGDRLRNLLLASTEGDEQQRVYEQLWVPLEDKVGAAEDPADVTAVVHAWLAERYRKIQVFGASDVYGLLKKRLREEYRGSLADLLAAIDAYADRYLSDAEYRAEADKSAEAWVASKPGESISDYKVFGD